MLALLVVATLFPVRGMTQALDATRLVGRWSGSGTFSNVAIQKKVGSLPFVAEFKADRSATGRVGNATLQDARVKSTRDLLEVRAKLAGSLVTKVSDNTIEAEFHLKSNFAFDPRMRDGRVVLTRIRE